MKLLFTVVDTFSITGRGVVLAPGLSYLTLQKFSVTKGSRLRLCKPDSTFLDTVIRDLERFSYRAYKPIEERVTPILLPNEIQKEDVPVGTEVYLLTD